MTTPSSAKSDFVAAEEIKAILRDREKNEQERILRWVAESLNLASAPTSAPPTPQASPIQPTETAIASPSHAIDLRTFVDEKQPRTDTQFAATIAYFYRFMAPESERKDTITTQDLQTASRLANRKRFDSPSVPLNNAVANGFLDRGGRGEYRINAVGENLIAMTLPETNNRSRTPVSRKKRGSAQGSKSKRKG